MEKEARETRQRLDAILESAVDGILSVDEHGTIESANQAAVDIFGYSREELIGTSVNRLMPLPYRDEHDGYIAGYVETGVAKIIGSGREVAGLRQDGSEFPLYLAVSEGRHGDRRVFTGIVRDLTELRMAEERARAAEELASLSLITAGIAHDIGTPMNVILGYSEMLRDSLSDPKDQRRAEIIAEQVRRVADLLQTLLNIARPHARVREPVRIGHVLDHAFDFFRDKLRARGIEIEREDQEVSEILGDRDRLEQVFLNLIVNAADAMPHGGKLVAKVDGDADGRVRVAIEDTGHGIDPESLERIFEPFYTSKERGQGTGLGLVVSRSIVIDHDGTITAESEVGKGTRFVLCFPAATARA